ncbi:MAG: metallophosphoesterase [Clostridia bacterium]|nr:metallophosphoesterase [Clostridia bacterium]
MKLNRRFAGRNTADGTYRVQCGGAQRMRLAWDAKDGEMEDYLDFACLPMDENGCAEFVLSGEHSVPPGATHIRLTAEFADGHTRTRRFLIPETRRTQPIAPALRLCLMSDLHMTKKPFRLRNAIRMGSAYDAILFAGDITNDGTPEQFERVRQIIEEEAPDTPVIAVCGNHDWPHRPMPEIFDGVSNYYLFQRWLLERAQRMGVEVSEDDSGAFAARIKGVPIFGLNAVSHFRRFIFHDGRQLDWLERQLSAAGDGTKIVMCHAPLRAHRPAKESEAPYLSRDARLQAIINGAKNVVFHSGHTHVTLNEMNGCVEHDHERGHVYLNDGSICVTTFRVHEAIEEEDWLAGAVAELSIAGDEIEIAGRTIYGRKRFGRAYYRFGRKE